MKQFSLSISALSFLAVISLSACSGYGLQNMSPDEVPVEVPPVNGGGGGGGGISGGGGGGSTGGGGTVTGGGSTGGDGGTVVVTDGPDKGKPYCHDDNGDTESSGNKVLVCHVPPGNPARAHNILISKQSWENGHKKHHDDYLGLCKNAGGDGGDSNDDYGAEVNCYKPCE